MLIKYLNEVLTILKKHRVGLLPCSEEEILKLEEHIGRELPQAYKEYLATMGKYSGIVNAGTDCFYEDLFELNQDALELLLQNKIEIQLSDDAFVFCMHQGYQFLFFKLDEGENPPVYGYSEGNVAPNFEMLCDSFSNYLMEVVSAHNLS
jgi:hypothetical protein